MFTQISNNFNTTRTSLHITPRRHHQMSKIKVDDILNSVELHSYKHNSNETVYLYYHEEIGEGIAIVNKTTNVVMEFPKAVPSYFEPIQEFLQLDCGLYLLKTKHQRRILSRYRDLGLGQTDVSAYMCNLLEQNLPNLAAKRKNNSLSLIRANGSFDFEIVSKEGTSIGVHTLVLAAVWPFFKGLLDSNMKETDEKKLVLPYPHSWIEAMVSYFYEQQVGMDMDEATGVLVLSGVYDIPELRAEAIVRIKSMHLTVDMCLRGWRNAFEAQCEEIQLFLANQLRENLSLLHSLDEFLGEFSQQEAIQLVKDISRC